MRGLLEEKETLQTKSNPTTAYFPNSTPIKLATETGKEMTLPEPEQIPEKVIDDVFGEYIKKGKKVEKTFIYELDLNQLVVYYSCHKSI